MRKFRPNALSLAVAIAISSSIIVTQALADRRLQIKSFDIRDNGHKEFTRSEVIVKPTSGDDQQPIPGSFTTTYPDQTEVRAGYDVPSEAFTDVLSGIEGGVSSVDLFATDDNEIAQKYTKVLKVGNEEIFKFTHDLAETKLVIEVRKGMTDQSSIAAVRAQSDDIQPLEPFTKVANPELLVGVLKGANERAGSLGEVDHYVALATIEVDKVEVNGRTFMRLIAAGDQPPELQRLGQSLFVNDEVLLAAATSAYARVHLLGEDLQQETLNKLLSCHKPVGYVVYVEDDTQAYPVPAGFPKLEVTETPGEIIVFRGQKQNPTDIAFIEGIYDVWMEEFYNSPRPRETIQVKKDRVKSYQYIIRSRQMAQLEELAAEHNNGIVKSEHTSLLYHGKLVTFAYYEYLQQTLTCAASDGADEFKFTMPHVRFVSSFITPTWMHIQLVKRFSFKPVLGNLLTNRDFIQNIHEIIRSDISVFSNDYFDDPFSEEEGFASKVTGRFAGQLIEMENELQALRATEAKLNDQKELTERTLTERTIVSVIPSGQKKQKISGQAQYCVDELAQIHNRFDSLADSKQERQDIRTQSNPKPMPEVLETLSAVEKALKMHDLDENDDVYLRRRGISENMQEYIRDARQLAENEALDILDDVEVVLDIRVNEEDDKTTRLTRVFITLNRNPLSEKILDAVLNRIDNIRWQYESKTQDEKEHKLIMLLANLHDKVEGSDPDMQAREQQSAVLEAVEKILNIKFDEWDDNAARLARVHTLLADHDVSEQLLDQIDQTLWKEDSKALNKKDLKYNKIRETLIYKVEDAYLDKHAREQQTILLRAVEDELSINPDENVAARESGRAFTVKLAKDLNVALEQDDNLSDQKDILRARVLELIEESNTAYDDEAARRSWNNAVAHQLNIEDYREDAIINDQNSLIEKKLLQLDDLVINTGQPDVNERIAAIENELDRQLTRLGPRPRYVLDRELANARRALENAENGLKEVYRELKTISGKHVLFAGKRSDLQHLPDQDDATLNRLMKQFQTDFGLAAGDEQTSEERLEDIRHFLREHSTEKRDEIIETPGARADLDIHIKEDDLSSLQKNDYFFSVTSHKKNHGPDETGTLEEALGELPLARKKYTQITEFLREHHKKFMDVINAMSEQRDAQENLDRKQQKIIDFGGIDEEAKTLHKHEMVELSLILKQKCEAVSKAEDALTNYNVAFLGTTEEAVDLKPDTSDTFRRRLDILRNRQVQLGGHDGTGGEIRQLIQEQARLEDELEPRKANIERIREVLKAAEEAVENDVAPSQFTPRQIKVLTDIHDFMQQHSLKKQALEAAMGLAELAEKRGGLIPYFPALGFADELQPLRLIASIGDGLTLDQASRIVEVFKSLKTTFPPPLNPGKDQPLNVPKKVHELVVRARRELQNGAQQYDDEIRGMGKTAIHFVECEPKELKSFSEYFAAHSASGHKIITLLREGLISKVELENYIKAVRSVDGYEPVEEFEHLLGYRRGIKLIHFRGVVHGLSEKSAEEFMQSAFAPVTVTTTGPAGMKASVAGMKEYAAVVIANYVLDDVAFENGRKTVAFLTNVQDTLTPYANAVGVSESELIKA
ncbi:hypothetical protein, partial [Endozoicomonas sp. SESOKO2]|uniref:hypothetical protein n=1 Tax=Endozoicomonas sp. SESOKO2 TaxID=2828743 RepID=UPI0021497A7F